MSIHYIGTVTFRQNHPPAWSKNYTGETDTCSVIWQGAQYLLKGFLDSLTKYQSLLYIDEIGSSYFDSGMKLIRWSNDDSPIFPSVTLYYEGCRNGSRPDPSITDDITTQSASTSAAITGGDNDGKTITLSIQYYSARTTYEWVQLTDPAGTSLYTTIRNPLTYSQPPGEPNIFFYRYSGMVDADGNPTRTIPTGDATTVWNTFAGTNVVSSLQAREVVPGHVWKCTATCEFLLIGA